MMPAWTSSRAIRFSPNSRTVPVTRPPSRRAPNLDPAVLADLPGKTIILGIIWRTLHRKTRPTNKLVANPEGSGANVENTEQPCYLGCDGLGSSPRPSLGPRSIVKAVEPRSARKWNGC